MYYKATIKNVERNGKRKCVGAGRGTQGVMASISLDTNARDIVGIELWLRDVDGKPRLQIETIGNGYNVNRNGEMLFDGDIDDFVRRMENG